MPAKLRGSAYMMFPGKLPENSSDFPERPEWEKDWSADTGVPLLSTYKEVLGEEPNFTNHAKVRCTSCALVEGGATLVATQCEAMVNGCYAAMPLRYYALRVDDLKR